ncbi:MAG: hypothetical protein IJG13_01250, partial [Kiritimatiellae bacterium]|nr:hypothetical protein [Kiritimatiellia bacterium]
VVDAIAALKPGFVRFPGGCAAQGRTFEEQFSWKRTICPPAERPCVSNLWGYTTSFRLGFYEYFLLCERLGAEPVPVVAAGMTCRHFSKPLCMKSLGAEMDAVAQDACDLVEFANGGVTTKWGARRAAMGHPKPFGMKYLSIGNEDVGADYFVRYRAIAKAVRARHPEIRLIAAAHRAKERDQGYSEVRRELTSDIADILDEHFYFSRDWLERECARFDAYPRSQRLAVTEYAHKERGTENTPRSALLDMAFLLNLLRNADLVEMTSYAPLLAWKGRENWRPNLIEFDGRALTLTPNYDLHVRFAGNRPDEVLDSRSDTTNGFHHVVGRKRGRLQLQCVNLGAEPREVIVRIGGRRVARTVPPQSYQCLDLDEDQDRVLRVDVPSPSMGRTVPVAVVLPRYYGRNGGRHPVVVCLHGVGGTSSTFLGEPLFRAVDGYGFIAVCPQSGRSWWFDAPAVATNRYETFVSSELVEWIDRTYKTKSCRTARAIVGASMGGHGACWIGFRHPDVFGAVGNVYGGVDFTGFPKQFGLSDLLGPKIGNEETWRRHTALAASDSLADGTLDFIICVGVKDFFLGPNRALHKRLCSRGVRHAYLEIAGWDDAHMSHNGDFLRMAEPIIYARFASFFRQGDES